MSIGFFFPGPRSQRGLRVGPLAVELDGFASWLATQGYARQTGETKLRLVSHLSRWLEREGLGVEALDEARFERFLRTRGKPNGGAVLGRELLAHLRRGGRIPDAPKDTGGDDAITRIERIHERFLVNERGLSPLTVGKYLPVVHAFLTERFGTGAVALETLVARDANRFIVRHSQGFARSHGKGLAAALRSFLRHLHQRGDIAVDLAGAIPPITNWRLSELPKSLPPEGVQSVLESCDRNTAVGRRDHAILLLLARLGLRGGEVATLTLDDIDWDKGLVTLSGKGQRREALPLTEEVGSALAAYLRGGRPSCGTRRVFVRAVAPHRGFSTTAAICDIVRRALARAGIDPPLKGAHLLRRSLACGMLRNGASLEEIGQILRHRHPETTQIYAKVDLEALRTLAPAWPGGAS